VGTTDQTRDDDLERAPLVPPPYPTPATFVAALRAGEPAALRALFLFYTPLLRDQARRLGIEPDDRAELVTTLLDDFILHAQDAVTPPRDVARYLVAAVRNRVRNHYRARTRMRVLTERAATTLPGTEQRVVAECHSEYDVRTSSSASVTPTPLDTAVTKLAVWSAQALREDDQTLMMGVSHHVPIRELAAQLGISYAAARVRVHRLRERFRKLVLQHVKSLDAEEQREVERFLRRAGHCLEPRAERAGGKDDAV
jgi:DNA-directed RNA polymerase specialized sigma subunit, sigma24 homolog